MDDEFYKKYQQQLSQVFGVPSITLEPQTQEEVIKNIIEPWDKKPVSSVADKTMNSAETVHQDKPKRPHRHKSHR